MCFFFGWYHGIDRVYYNKGVSLLFFLVVAFRRGFHRMSWILQVNHFTRSRDLWFTTRADDSHATPVGALKTTITVVETPMSRAGKVLRVVSN